MNWSCKNACHQTSVPVSNCLFQVTNYVTKIYSNQKGWCINHPTTTPKHHKIVFIFKQCLSNAHVRSILLRILDCYTFYTLTMFNNCLFYTYIWNALVYNTTCNCRSQVCNSTEALNRIFFWCGCWVKVSNKINV